MKEKRNISESQGSACGFDNNDLLLHLLYLDYHFPAASLYFNHDDYGRFATTPEFNVVLGNETLTRAVKHT